LAAVAFSVAQGPRQPLLRVNPELAERAPSGPSYLGGGQAERTAGPGQVQPGGEPVARAVSPTVPAARTATHTVPAEPRSGPQPEPARKAGDTKTPESAQPLPAPPRRPPQEPSKNESPTNASPKRENRAASSPARPQETPAKRENHQPAVKATRADAVSALVGRLEGSVGRGDLAGVVGLFTANAVVNSGAGTAAIRSEYSELFSLAGQRRMTIWGLTWRKTENRRLSARGAIRIRTRSDPGAAWSTATGMVELEIVPWMGDYKISKMISHLSRE